MNANRAMKIWRRVCFGILALDAWIIVLDVSCGNYSGAMMVATAAAMLWLALLFMKHGH